MKKLLSKLLGIAHLATNTTNRVGSMDRDYLVKLAKQSGAGLFFSICSILIVFINKFVLTTFRLVINSCNS